MGAWVECDLEMTREVWCHSMSGDCPHAGKFLAFRQIRDDRGVPVCPLCATAGYLERVEMWNPRAKTLTMEETNSKYGRRS